VNCDDGPLHPAPAAKLGRPRPRGKRRIDIGKSQARRGRPHLAETNTGAEVEPAIGLACNYAIRTRARHQQPSAADSAESRANASPREVERQVRSITNHWTRPLDLVVLYLVTFAVPHPLPLAPTLPHLSLKAGEPSRTEKSSLSGAQNRGSSYKSAVSEITPE